LFTETEGRKDQIISALPSGSTQYPFLKEDFSKRLHLYNFAFTINNAKGNSRNFLQQGSLMENYCLEAAGTGMKSRL